MLASPPFVVSIFKVVVRGMWLAGAFYVARLYGVQHAPFGLSGIALLNDRNRERHMSLRGRLRP